jgi:large subunit ribosomal protein L23
MKKIVPILTEKTLADAKEGKYTFWVDRSWNKHKIADEIERLFDVEVGDVRTINYRKIRKRNYLGRYKEIPSRKKTIIGLKGKGKIDIFESKGK